MKDGEAEVSTWADACSERRARYRVGPLLNRTKADDRMETGIFVGYRSKSNGLYEGSLRQKG